MTETEKLVSKIVQAIDNLPEKSLHEVLDLVARLSNGDVSGESRQNLAERQGATRF